jgi:hypothetical protein
MPDKIVCCLILVSSLCPFRTRAQDNSSVVAEGKTSILMTDGNGMPFENHGSDIAGTPFLREDWSLGSVTLQNNRRFDSVRIRLNLETGQVHFLDEKSQEIALYKGYIKMVRFYDILPGTTGVSEFQTGFPPIDNQDENCFYQVISKGKISLLKFMHKIVSGQKDQLSGEVRKEYLGYEDYYVSKCREISRVKKDRSVVLSLLADQQARIQSFIETNHLKLKSIEDIKLLIDYYNSL